MFGPDQAARRGQVLPHLPEAIGLGGSSEPSDGLHDRFPRYGYKVMGSRGTAVTEGLGIKHLRLVFALVPAWAGCTPGIGENNTQR
jgi:homoserine O-acetyltransferase/O-succinyltransferase